LKVIPFLFGSHLSVGIISFPVAFLMTDVVGEVYGRRVAKLFVLGGFISIALFILYSLVSLWAPWSADGFWAKDGYNLVFGVSTRIALASLLAFVGAYSTGTLISLIITWWLYKVLMGAVYTPLTYLGVYLLKEPETV